MQALDIDNNTNETSMPLCSPAYAQTSGNCFTPEQSPYPRLSGYLSPERALI